MSDFTAHDARITLRAGGIAPLGTPMPEDERASAVGAHAYTHPAIAGRVVVQLAATAVVAGTDAEMSALGFTKARSVADLGLVRYRRLGFPAWPLVHDPSKARFALEVTQDLRKAKKRAASKPGAAREAFDEIGKRLARTVPHFLPSFWEEAGRIMSDAGGPSMAAQCFEKAREAERAHGLHVDPDDRDAVFLEFALLGALSAKTLSAYAKELERTQGSKDAHARFSSIALKRARGGFPPWAGMTKELRALALAAGLDADRAEEVVVSELLTTQAVGRAPREFWSSAAATIVRIVRPSASLRELLRGLFPSPKGETTEQRKKFALEWLELLDEAGALAVLPDEGLSQWMSKLIRFAGDLPRVSALLRELAPRLKEPISVVVKQGYSQRLSLSLAELALSLGVPLSDPGPTNFHGLTSDPPCDPAHVAVHPEYGPRLVILVSRIMGAAAEEARMQGKAGFDLARRAWLEEHVRSLEGRGLVRFEAGLGALVQKTTATTWAVFPDLRARVVAARVVDSLRLVLLEGIFDELGWPALEGAVERLGADTKLGGAFPVLVAHDGSRAIALDHTGVVLEHDFVVDATTEAIEHAVFVDGQLLVSLRNKASHDILAYWSETPSRRFAYERRWGSVGVATTLRDGSVTLGGRAFRAGDTTVAWFERHAFDGTTVFKTVYRAGEVAWVEYDPVRDKLGRASKPSFFESFAKPETKLSALSTSLHAVPVDASPLGVKDGLCGFRVRTASIDARRVEAERIDGESIDLELAWVVQRVDGLLSMPGRERPLVTEQTGSNTRQVTAILRTRGGEDLANLDAHPWASEGTKHVPPYLFWHYLTPRDARGSGLLRGLGEADAAQLLEAAAADLSDANAASPRTTAAVRALGIANERLVKGVVGVARHAAALGARLRSFVDDLGGDVATEGPPGEDALASDGTRIVQIAAAMKKGVEQVIAQVDIDLAGWLERPRGKAMRARAPLSDESVSVTARDIVRGLARAALDEGGAAVRVMKVKPEADFFDKAGWRGVRIEKAGASTFAINASAAWVVERSTDGTFRLPPKYSMLEERHPTPIDEAFAASFEALGAGAATFVLAHAELLASRAGLSRAEAGILLVGAPVDAYGNDFLGKPRREALGLKLVEAEAARGLFKSLAPGVLDEVFERAARDASALEGEAWIEGLGDAWREVVGTKVAVPEELLVAAQKDLGTRTSVHRLLSVQCAPKPSDFAAGVHTQLARAPTWTQHPGKEGLDADFAEELALMLAWTAFHTPVGDPSRRCLPTAFAMLREGVSNPELLWGLGAAYSSVAGEKDLAAILGLVPGPPVLHAADHFGACTDGRDTGTLAVGAYGKRLLAAFRPGKVQRWDDPMLLALMKRVGETLPSIDGLTRSVAVARWILGDDLRALVESAAQSTLAPGSFEANPLMSAPQVVSDVANALSLSAAASTLYLQLLGIAEPTDKSVLRWNAWKPKAHAAAVAELKAKELVVVGKRERAQREVFLPGGFGKGSGKNLPMEEWKAPFYALHPLRRNVPSIPLATLFERAWKRVRGGDAPRFEKVR